MGCDRYTVQSCTRSGEWSEESLSFAEIDDDSEVGCLCTFPHNWEMERTLDRDDVRSMAILGATVVLMHRGLLPHGIMPHCLPGWIRSEIDRVLGLNRDAK